MTIERIFLAGQSGQPQVEAQSVRVQVKTGIEGDRYFGGGEWSGRNVTLIEAEAIEAFAAETGRTLELSCTRRNLITRGVRLNDLVDREFTIGSVRLRGVQLCEPCMSLGERLALPDLPAADVVKWFLHRGGIRARIVESGSISVGQAVVGLG